MRIMFRTLRPLQLLLLLFTLIVLSSPGASLSAPLRADAAAEPAPTDRLIVQLSEGPAASLQATDATAQIEAQLGALAGTSLQVVRSLRDDTLVLALPELQPYAAVMAVATRLSASPDVRLAVPDERLFVAREPLDEGYLRYGWPLWTPSEGSYGLNLPQAWDLTTGAPEVGIAIVDTGIRPEHEDLAGRANPDNLGYDLISDLAYAADGDARDPDPSDPGDFVTSAEAASGPLEGCMVTASSWHGTHVAGIIGAQANNERGLVGINWRSPLLYVRALGKCGGYVSDIADGIRWAVGEAVFGAPLNPNPVRVINLSLGGSGTCNPFFQEAITTANAHGAVVVAAAGNQNRDASSVQPGNCQGVITVAATTRRGERAGYSNFGDRITVAAPGGDRSVDSGIYSTLNSGLREPVGDSYGFYQGTSMAAPHVAGVVSLMLAVNPTLSSDDVRAILQQTVTPFPANSSCPGLCGAGIVNAGAAVAEAARQVSGMMQLTPTSLSFGSQALDEPGPSRSLSMRNTGNGNLTVSALRLEGAFRRVGGSCAAALPLVLAAGEACTLELAFTPTTIGEQNGALVLASDAPDSPHRIALSGTGLASTLSTSPSSLSFGQQQLGSSSTARTITLSSSGNLSLTLNQLSLSGPFERVGGTCALTLPLTLAPGASCSVSVRFKPTWAGPIRGALRISSDAYAAPPSVLLSGEGLTPVLGFGPTHLSFGLQSLGEVGPSRPITLTNPGNAPLTINALSLSAGFEQVSGGSCPTNFPQSLAPGTSCSLLVRFAPDSFGQITGSLTVIGDLPAGPYSVPLIGSGSTALLAVDQPELHFGSQPVGSMSMTRSLTLSNPGDRPLSLQAIQLSEAGFAQVGGSCPASLPAPLAAGASCTLDLRFTPTESGAFSETLHLLSDAPGGSLDLPLAGLGTVGLAPSALLTPPPVFQLASLATATVTQSVELRNVGEAPLQVSAINVSGAGFSASFANCGENLPLNLAPGVSCTLDLHFAPTDVGLYSGTLALTTNDGAGERRIALQGERRADPQAIPTVSAVQLESGTERVSLDFTLTRASGSGPLVVNYTVTGERDAANDDLVLATAQVALPANSSNVRVSLSFARATLYGVTHFALDLDEARLGVRAGPGVLQRVGVPAAQSIVLLPLIQR